MKKIMTMGVMVLMASSMVLAAEVSGWDAFVIRNANGNGHAPVISDDVGGGKLFQVHEAGQKAGWGTNSMNGQTIGDIQSISITRNSSVGYGPYINIWITDGNGNYAVIANEPSNTGEWTPGTPYNVTWDVLKNATAKVYETYGMPFAMPSGTTFTFSNFANYTIATPSSHWGGTGAPDDLNASSYTAYGINWVFGDTLNNYTADYLVSNPTVIPEPATICFLALSGLGLLRRKVNR